MWATTAGAALACAAWASAATPAGPVGSQPEPSRQAAPGAASASAEVRNREDGRGGGRVQTPKGARHGLRHSWTTRIHATLRGQHSLHVHMTFATPWWTPAPHRPSITSDGDNPDSDPAQMVLAPLSAVLGDAGSLVAATASRSSAGSRLDGPSLRGPPTKA